MEALIVMGSVDAGVASVLRILVQAGYNIFISDGTGSGKTEPYKTLHEYKYSKWQESVEIAWFYGKFVLSI